MDGAFYCIDNLTTLESAKGDIFWFLNGKLHRLNDLPAIECANGDREWYVNGELHRRDGLPAIEYMSGEKQWYENGKLHRIGGLSAIENTHGGKFWYENGKCHRLAALHAIECENGNKLWYIYDKEYTHKQVISYYEILARFGRYCLKKIRLRQLKRVKFTHVELSGMPAKGKYLGGQYYHKVITYFTLIYAVTSNRSFIHLIFLSEINAPIESLMSILALSIISDAVSKSSSLYLINRTMTSPSFSVVTTAKR